jgi:RND family efflux transporter MFP subunit
MTTQQAPTLLRFIRSLAAPGGPSHETDEQLLHRFARHGDQAAFTALVARHGSLVLGVCGRALRDSNDVEDAFQATFLILARKACSLARPHLLAPWLYGVARRTALEARGRTTRRQAKEHPLGDVAAAEATPHVVWSDLRPVLDAEIARLPERYRVPFVLCYLEGRTNIETARLIGCPEGTVASRLAWARERLRGRLTRRGVSLSAALGAAVLSGKAAVSWAARPVTAQVGSLAAEVLRQMFWTKVQMAAGLLLTLCLLLGGGGILLWSAQANGQDGPAVAAPEALIARPLVREVTEEEEFSGITAVESIDVRAGMHGVLSTIHVKEGEAVKEGQLLADLDSAPFKAALDQATASLAQSEGLLLRAGTDYQRALELYKEGIAAKKNVEQASVVLAEATAAVEAARTARDVARISLAHTQIQAPVAGRVHRLAGQGTRVRADDPVAGIVGSGRAYVYFEAPLRVLTVLAGAKEGEGLPVAIGIGREQGCPRRGTVQLADTRVNADKGALQLKAVLPGDGIQSGQLARVRLRAGKPYQALLVPDGAVSQDKTGAFVLVVRKDVVERRQVVLGPLHDGLRVVKDGLHATDWVVLGGARVQPGMTAPLRKVRLLEEPATGKAAPSPVNTRTVFMMDKGLLMTVPLERLPVQEALQVLKQLYRDQLAPRGKLVLIADERTNSLSVAGPTDLVLEVVKLVASLNEIGSRSSREPPAQQLPDHRAIEESKARIDSLTLEVATLKDRVAWSERMLKKGFMTEQQAQAERARLHQAEIDLARAAREFRFLGVMEHVEKEKALELDKARRERLNRYSGSVVPVEKERQPPP